MLAELEYHNCDGLALSPQHPRLTFCGLTPLGVRPPGSPLTHAKKAFAGAVKLWPEAKDLAFLEMASKTNSFWHELWSRRSFRVSFRAWLIGSDFDRIDSL